MAVTLRPKQFLMNLNAELFHLNQRLKIKEQTPLSGGIVARNLKIVENDMGMLVLNGNINITIKLLNLCSNPTPSLPFLITSTKQLILSLINGPVYTTGNNFFKYDSKKNRFDNKSFATFSIMYNFKFDVNIIEISSVTQLKGNDFVIAVVDDIGARFKDHYGTYHKMAGFESGYSGGPIIIAYQAWVNKRTVATHEFFHTLSLKDSESVNDKNSLMYHLEDGLGTSISSGEKIDVMRYIMGDLRTMTKSNYSNANLNTVLILRQQLNNPANVIQYNKNSFR
jgi:hypothetical protein